MVQSGTEKSAGIKRGTAVVEGKFIGFAAAAVILAIIILVLYLISKLRNVLHTLTGLKTVAEGLAGQEELAETPKSISGMTRIYEPQIQRDFPEFNWKEFKNKAEQLLVLAFQAISAGEESLIGGNAQALKQQVLLQIQENKRRQIKEQYEQVQIHNTEITRYEKKKGTCVITLQSAVGYIHYKEKSGKLIEGNREQKRQTKYNTELMYIQDAKAANMNHTVSAVCPGCGAPVTGLGNKKCEYCGSAVTPVNIQVWSIQGFYEVDYHRI